MGSGSRREVGIELKGKTYTVRELGLDEYGKIENFVKSKYARLYRESAAGLDPEKLEEQIMKTLKTAITPEELAAEMSATDCVAYVAYLSLRHNPGVTRDNISEIVDVDSIRQISAIIDSMGDDDENPPEAETESP
jgi:hypothetical protein